MTHRHYRHHRNDDGNMGCLAIVILGLIAMPIFGLYLLINSENSDDKALGLALLIIGIIIWIAISVNS